MIYLVATPIGNLEDITLRSLNVLKKVDIIACEDTRHTRILLDNYDIKDKKLISYHQHNEREKAQELVTLSKMGNDIALVSDAGMPGISDPGHEVVKQCIKENEAYTVLPGPSAMVTALVLSGFSNLRFKYLGFLPVKGRQRSEYLDIIKNESDTIIIYEAPHKLDKLMEDLNKICPDRKVACIREISKVYEEVVRFTVKDYPDLDLMKKGEFVVVLDAFDLDEDLSDEEIIDKLKELVASGMRKKEAVKLVAENYKLNKNYVYELSIKI